MPRQPESSTMRAAIISLAGELFTIELKSVREVFVVESITPVPGMPSGLVGVTNLRGTVIPLLDLGRCSLLTRDEMLQYAVVVKHGNWQVGVLVDTVPEIRTHFQKSISAGSDGHGGRDVSLRIDGGQTRGPVARGFGNLSRAFTFRGNRLNGANHSGYDPIGIDR